MSNYKTHLKNSSSRNLNCSNLISLFGIFTQVHWKNKLNFVSSFYSSCYNKILKNKNKVNKKESIFFESKILNFSKNANCNANLNQSLWDEFLKDALDGFTRWRHLLAIFGNDVQGLWVLMEVRLQGLVVRIEVCRDRETGCGSQRLPIHA